MHTENAGRINLSSEQDRATAESIDVNYVFYVFFIFVTFLTFFNVFFKIFYLNVFTSMTESTMSQ